ncbi:hypothetical protein [Streptomyces sp. NBC_01373]|nr:hypothetical protein [Streptomyces sp. NBC_01373]
MSHSETTADTISTDRPSPYSAGKSMPSQYCGSLREITDQAEGM